jgi:hypothetical protein
VPQRSHCLPGQLRPPAGASNTQDRWCAVPIYFLHVSGSQAATQVDIPPAQLQHLQVQAEVHAPAQSGCDGITCVHSNPLLELTCLLDGRSTCDLARFQSRCQRHQQSNVDLCTPKTGCTLRGRCLLLDELAWNHASLSGVESTVQR